MAVEVVMLGEKKPSERVTGMYRALAEDEVARILDEHHAAILSLQRERAPGTSGGDALERLNDVINDTLRNTECEWDNDELVRRLRVVIASLEAERTSQADVRRGLKLELSEARNALTAEQRALKQTEGDRNRAAEQLEAVRGKLEREQRTHGETKEQLRSVAECHCQAEETIAQLQRDLAERTEELRASRNGATVIANERDLFHADLVTARRERDQARKERDELEKLAIAMADDRDRLQGELENWKRDFATADKRLADAIDRETALAEKLQDASDELATLRAQSSDGKLREAIENLVQHARGAGLRSVWVHGLETLLASHPAPTPATETAPVQPNLWREALERAWGLESDPENHTVEWAEELALKMREIGNRQAPVQRDGLREFVAALRADLTEQHAFFDKRTDGDQEYSNGSRDAYGYTLSTITQLLAAVAPSTDSEEAGRGDLAKARADVKDLEAENDACGKTIADLRARIEKAAKQVSDLHVEGTTSPYVYNKLGEIFSTLTTPEKASGADDDDSAFRPFCAHCENKPAACLGSYEGRPFEYACNDCCGHGCEDGRCYPLHELPGVLTKWNTDDDSTPSPTDGQAMAERIVERLNACAGVSSESIVAWSYNDAIRIVREEAAREVAGEIPGVEWEHAPVYSEAVIRDKDGNRLELFQGQHQEPLLFCAQGNGCDLTRAQVRDTLIPLLSRFVATGSLKGGANG